MKGRLISIRVEGKKGGGCIQKRGHPEKQINSFVQKKSHETLDLAALTKFLMFQYFNAIFFFAQEPVLTSRVKKDFFMENKRRKLSSWNIS